MVLEYWDGTPLTPVLEAETLEPEDRLNDFGVNVSANTIFHPSLSLIRLGLMYCSLGELGRAPIQKHRDSEFFIGGPDCSTGKIGGYGFYSKSIKTCGFVRHVGARQRHGGKGQGDWLNIRFEDDEYDIRRQGSAQDPLSSIIITPKSHDFQIQVGANIDAVPEGLPLIGLDDAGLYVATPEQLSGMPADLTRYVTFDLD